MRVCLIPAAGASSRMRGADKLMELVDGVPCLRVLADRAAAAGAHVIAALPHPAHPRAVALADSAAQLVYVPGYAPGAADGMSVTLKTGLAAVPAAASGVMILPADMPGITARDMTHLWDAFESGAPDVLRATSVSGADGHPVIFQTRHLSLFDDITGDQGAMAALKSSDLSITRIALADTRATCDLDTPEDWAAWRASRAGSTPE